MAGFPPQGSWIQYDYPAPVTIASYAITSAGDGMERDPKDWQLLGSNDGQTWTALDTQTDVRWSQRHQTRRFSCGTKAACRYCRLKISAVRDAKIANSVQVAEITFTQ